MLLALLLAAPLAPAQDKAATLKALADTVRSGAVEAKIPALWVLANARQLDEETDNASKMRIIREMHNIDEVLARALACDLRPYCGDRRKTARKATEIVECVDRSFERQAMAHGADGGAGAHIRRPRRNGAAS